MKHHGEALRRAGAKIDSESERLPQTLERSIYRIGSCVGETVFKTRHHAGSEAERNRQLAAHAEQIPPGEKCGSHRRLLYSRITSEHVEHVQRQGGRSETLVDCRIADHSVAHTILGGAIDAVFCAPRENPGEPQIGSPCDRALDTGADPQLRSRTELVRLPTHRRIPHRRFRRIRSPRSRIRSRRSRSPPTSKAPRTQPSSLR